MSRRLRPSELSFDTVCKFLEKVKTSPLKQRTLLLQKFMDLNIDRETGVSPLHARVPDLHCPAGQLVAEPTGCVASAARLWLNELVALRAYSEVVAAAGCLLGVSPHPATGECNAQARITRQLRLPANECQPHTFARLQPHTPRRPPCASADCTVLAYQTPFSSPQ